MADSQWVQSFSLFCLWFAQPHFTLASVFHTRLIYIVIGCAFLAAYIVGSYLMIIQVTASVLCSCILGGYLFTLGTNHVLRLHASVYNLAHDLVNIRGIHKWSTGSCMVLVLRSNRLSCNAQPTARGIQKWEQMFTFARLRL